MAGGARRLVLVAVDNSEASERALDWAVANVLGSGDAELKLLHVVPFTADGADPAVDAQKVKEAEGFMRERFGAKMDAKAVPYEFVIVHMVPESESVGHEICKQAEALQVAAVVMSRHQRGALGQLLMGSSAAYVAKHCKQAVVVVH